MLLKISAENLLINNKVIGFDVSGFLSKNTKKPKPVIIKNINRINNHLEASAAKE